MGVIGDVIDQMMDAELDPQAIVAAFDEAIDLVSDFRERPGWVGVIFRDFVEATRRGKEKAILVLQELE